MQDLTAHLYPAESNKIHAQNIQTYSVVGHTVRDHFGTQFTQFTTQVTQFTTQVTQLTTQSRIISARHADRQRVRTSATALRKHVDKRILFSSHCIPSCFIVRCTRLRAVRI